MNAVRDCVRSTGAPAPGRALNSHRRTNKGTFQTPVSPLTPPLNTERTSHYGHYRNLHFCNRVNDKRDSQLPTCGAKPVPASVLNYCPYQCVVQALGFVWSVTHASALEKNIPTYVSRQEPKLLLHLAVFNCLNFTLFAQLLLSLLLSVAIPTNSAKWTDYILTKQAVKHTVSTFPAYGILFGKKEAMYIPCQHCAPKKKKSQRKKYTMFWQRQEKIWGLAKVHFVFLASFLRLCCYTSTLQNNIQKSQNK